MPQLSSQRRSRIAGVAALVFLYGSAAGASERMNAAYWRGYLTDTGKVLKAPFDWEPEQHAAGLVVVGAAYAVYTADQAIRNDVAEALGPTGRDAARGLEPLGDGLYLAPLLAATYAAGASTGDLRARRAGMYGLESFVVSGLIVTGAKQLAGRHRPNTGDGRKAWDGPTGSGSTRRHSFPSGHATSAFAVATVFADEFEDVAGAPASAYALAWGVAAARVAEDKHWASDVMFGAALGYFTAKAIVGYHARRREFGLVPRLEPGFAGFELTRAF